VVHVFENHRASVCRDASGEAAANGDPDALLHLLLDPDSLARDQLLPPLVEQQGGAGVGLEEIADAPEQRVEKVPYLQLAQRSVGEGLEAAKPLGVSGV